MDDWQIGDLALCVDAGPLKYIDGLPEARREYVEALVAGRLYKVTHISKGRTCDCIGLGDANYRAGGVSTRFRKIRPLTDEEREDFSEDLRFPDHDRLATTEFSAALRGRNGEPAPASPPNPAGAGTHFSGNHR